MGVEGTQSVVKRIRLMQISRELYLFGGWDITPDEGSATLRVLRVRQRVRQRVVFVGIKSMLNKVLTCEPTRYVRLHSSLILTAIRNRPIRTPPFLIPLHNVLNGSTPLAALGAGWQDLSTPRTTPRR